MNVLLVEDSKGDVLLIETAFEEIGISYELTVKENGRDAVNFLNETEISRNDLPELIILDLNLPILNGFDVLLQIKKSIIFNNIPVIIFSSSAEERDKIRAFELGAAAYFTKPVEYEDYIATVESFLAILR